MNKGLRIFLKTLFITIFVILTIAIYYVAYVFISYHRIKDNQVLEIKQQSVIENITTNQEYSIVTFNAGFGAYVQDFTFFMDGGKESWARSKQSTIDTINGGGTLIDSLNPDFIVIQEVDLKATRTYHVNEVDLYDQLYPEYSRSYAVNYDSPFLMYPFYQPHGASKSSIVTYSKYMIESGLRRSLPVSNSISKILDLDRCYSKVKIKIDNGKYLVLYNVHLSAYGSSAEVREGQTRMLFSDMKEEFDQGNYCICGGDYNHDLTGDSIYKLNNNDPKGVEELGWAQPFPVDILSDFTGIKTVTNYNDGLLLPTCRNCNEPYKIGNFTIIVDGFLISENVEVTYLENIQTDFIYSDHNPVLMKFILH